MKKVYVQKKVVGWEEYTYEVPDDFEDYESLLDNNEWADWEYLVDSSEETGEFDILDENFKSIYNDQSNAL